MKNIPYENQGVLLIFYKNFAVDTIRPDSVVKNEKGRDEIILELKAILL